MKAVLALVAVLALSVSGLTERPVRDVPARAAAAQSVARAAAPEASAQPAVPEAARDVLQGSPDEDDAAIPASSDEPALYGRYGEIWRVRVPRKEIALTFDDGPYPFYTPILLHILDRSHVPATFFVVGRSAQEFPELVTRIVDSGDEIGNHTFNHFTLTHLSDAQIEAQIASDGALLRQYTGCPVSLFRPPHGRYNRHVVSIAHDLGYRTIFWSDAANDVKDIPPDVITQRVVDEASPGGIVLLHSGQYRTIEALPVIIDTLRAQGYDFVTVSKLIEDGEQP